MIISKFFAKLLILRRHPPAAIKAAITKAMTHFAKADFLRRLYFRIISSAKGKEASLIGGSFSRPTTCQYAVLVNAAKAANATKITELTSAETDLPILKYSPMPQMATTDHPISILTIFTHQPYPFAQVPPAKKPFLGKYHQNSVGPCSI